MKAKLTHLLSEAALLLGVAASMPYAFGPVADVLPPEGKKWFTISALAIAAAGKAVAYGLDFLNRQP